MRRVRPVPAVLALLPVTALLVVPGPSGAAAPARAHAAVAAPVAAPRAAVGPGRVRPAVIETRVLGHSRAGRPIVAWHLGTPGPGVRRVVLVSTMHGDEAKVSHILTSLRDGRPVTGLDLWVVPTYNPDGRARHRRQNARGVDLNRNYPTSWRRATGRFASGSAPASEPETRAMMAFLREVRPSRLISFHQPLHGVDTLTKSPRFSAKLARALHLPRKRFSCHGGCHGTMTMWFNRHFPGQAVTVEYGRSPSRAELRGPVVRRVLRLFSAHR